TRPSSSRATRSSSSVAPRARSATASGRDATSLLCFRLVPNLLHEALVDRGDPVADPSASLAPRDGLLDLSAEHLDDGIIAELAAPLARHHDDVDCAVLA